MNRKIKEKDAKIVNALTIYGSGEEKNMLKYLEKKHIIYGFSPIFEMYSKELNQYVRVRSVMIATTQDKIDAFMKMCNLNMFV